MSEASKRIMVSECGKAIVTDQTALPNDVEYFHRAAVLAAIKRALEEAMRIDAEYWKGSSRVSALIAELDPAQFIEEKV